MTLEIFYLLYAGVIGLLIGSFLNVVILRFPPYLMWQWKQQATEYLELDASTLEQQPAGIVVKRSGCPKCGHQLSWWENIPVLSFVLLRGKCKNCSQKISWQYPLVELAMGILAVASVFAFGWSIQALIAGALLAVLLVCTGIDFKTQLLPDEIVLPTLWAGILLSITPYQWITPTQSILGAAIGYLSLWSIFWLFKLITGKDGMGYGDFKLLALLGAFFGPISLIPILLIACISGSIIGIVLRMSKGESLPFAFGPYLAIAGGIYLFFQDNLLKFLQQ